MNCTKIQIFFLELHVLVCRDQRYRDLGWFFTEIDHGYDDYLNHSHGKTLQISPEEEFTAYSWAVPDIFSGGMILYVEGKGIALEEETRDGHVSPSGNGCTYPWLGYVQQFDLQKVFVFCHGSYVSPKNHMKSENTYHWKRRNVDRHHQFYPIFLGCKAQLLVFFPSIEPYWGTSFAQLHCSQGAGEIPGVNALPALGTNYINTVIVRCLTGRWLGWLFSLAIVGLVQCHEVYELQIGSLVEKAYPQQ